MLFVVGCSLFTVRCWLLVAYCVVGCCVLCVVCWLMFVVRVVSCL